MATGTFIVLESMRIGRWQIIGEIIGIYVNSLIGIHVELYNLIISEFLTPVYTHEAITTVLREFLMPVSESYISLWLMSHFALALHVAGCLLREGEPAFLLFTSLLSAFGCVFPFLPLKL